jgi:hypothetical protein
MIAIWLSKKMIKFLMCGCAQTGCNPPVYISNQARGLIQFRMKAVGKHQSNNPVEAQIKQRLPQTLPNTNYNLSILIAQF